MRTELVSIPTPTHPLDGGYYTVPIPCQILQLNAVASTHNPLTIKRADARPEIIKPFEDTEGQRGRREGEPVFTWRLR
jgi:hypothetical protein